ncbi:phosphatase PAP2 family protein [Neolewinella lacunae]|uniref:Phosphatase PAP2 family protein n=1 Tax=Neolewinella lacunae TaxID=1517758 RepID=A0A923TE04_9BACT|nr:phosphatase PAP2 family protein [Neolewinella lacunae]MBC6995397.1 phosphatase PAP2 family protein [Neolewinella lacunae]MDN3633109.1 phosphatase PAP2 family protein [Neolewinella lacunae]
MVQENLSEKVEASPWRFVLNNWLFIGCTCLLLIINAWLLFISKQGDELVFINQYRSPFWDVFFKVGTHFAEPVAYFGVLVIVTAFSYRKGLFVVVAGVLAGVVSGLLKSYFGQARPMRWFFDNYEEIWHSLNHFEEEWRSWDPDSSFPSGHATSAFALYGLLAFFARTRKMRVTVLCFFLATMVCFSRMYLLYHFLRDITVGAGLGLCLAAITYYLHRQLWPNALWLNGGWLDRFSDLPAVRRRIPPPE